MDRSNSFDFLFHSIRSFFLFFCLFSFFLSFFVSFFVARFDIGSGDVFRRNSFVAVVFSFITEAGEFIVWLFQKSFCEEKQCDSFLFFV